MNRQLYLYALIKTLYNKGGDFIDSFWPFVIQVSSDITTKTISELQNDLKTRFSLNIPLHVLKTIISRAKRRDYLKQDDNKYLLTKQGQETLNMFEEEGDVQRRIDALMQDIVDFFKVKKVIISLVEANSILSSFIQSNLGSLIEYINPSRAIEQTSLSNGKKQNENLLVEYLIDAQIKKPQQYQILKELVHGSIISSILFVPENADLNQINSNNFQDCTAYLDSNVALAILGLANPEQNDSTQELVKLMKNLGIKLRIYDFTVYQIRSLIGAYPREYDKYEPSIRVDSIHSNMQIAGWMPDDIQDYLFNLEKKFNENGVKVENANLNVDFEKPFNSKFELLKKYKTNDGQNEELSRPPSVASLNHDLMAIDKIREARKAHIYSIENCKALFLTSDIKLNRFDFIEFKHRDAHTVAEVMLDRIFASILWLKNPRVDISLKSIIASHTKNLFVKRPIWEQFYKELKKAEQGGKITDDQVSLLLYDKDTEAKLKELEDYDVGKVTQSFILQGVTETEKKVKSQIEEEKNKIREKFLKKLKETEEEQRQSAETMNRKLEEKLQTIRAGLRSESQSQAKKEIIMSLVALDLIIFFGIYWLLFIKVIIPIATIVIIQSFSGVSVLGILIGSYYGGKCLISIRTDMIYNKKTKILKLD